MFEAWSKAVGSIKIEALLEAQLKELESVIIDMNAEDQLFDKGEYWTGAKLPVPYAPFTIDYKLSKGQPVDRITLRDEGDFHSGFFVKYDNGIELWSTDGKTQDLVREWGEDIFGLSDENLSILIWSYLYPELLTEINSLWL